MELPASLAFVIDRDLKTSSGWQDGRGMNRTKAIEIEGVWVIWGKEHFVHDGRENGLV